MIHSPTIRCACGGQSARSSCASAQRRERQPTFDLQGERVLVLARAVAKLTGSTIAPAVCVAVHAKAARVIPSNRYSLERDFGVRAILFTNLDWSGLTSPAVARYRTVEITFPELARIVVAPAIHGVRRGQSAGTRRTENVTVGAYRDKLMSAGNSNRKETICLKSVCPAAPAIRLSSGRQ